jgi:hypothetical protein
MAACLSTTAKQSSSEGTTSGLKFPEIPALPHQPAEFKFPQRAFGVKSVTFRAFQAKWFKQWPFLHYSESEDLVYCHTCISGFKQGKMKAGSAESAFVSTTME